ncbi:MAG: hypothetical protein ACYC8V_02195 [Caulobacteraceae bacterium]
MRPQMWIGVSVAALCLCACGGKPSAVAGGGQTDAGASQAASAGVSTGGVGVQQAQAIPLVDGKPMWAANRRHSAEENAQYQFAKNGGDFGARSESDYVVKVHAFVERPPRDAQFLDRSNGDRLIYAPRLNTFAVVSKDGAPRTMFKPRAGAAYWTQQKDRESKSSAGGGGQG